MRTIFCMLLRGWCNTVICSINFNKLIWFRTKFGYGKNAIAPEKIKLECFSVWMVNTAGSVLVWVWSQNYNVWTLSQSDLIMPRHNYNVWRPASCGCDFWIESDVCWVSMTRQVTRVPSLVPLMQRLLTCKHVKPNQLYFEWYHVSRAVKKILLKSFWNTPQKKNK